MNHLVKVAGIQFLIYIGYTLILRLIVREGNGGRAAELNAQLIIFHAGVLFLTAIVFYLSGGRRMQGSSYMLTSFLILIVGMSICFFAYAGTFKL